MNTLSTDNRHLHNKSKGAPSLVLHSKASLRVPHIHRVKDGLEKTTLKPLINKINRRLALQEKVLAAFSPKGMGKRRVKGENKNLSVPAWTKGAKTKGNKARPNIGIVSVHSSRNNTLLSLSKSRGRVVKGGWASAGSVGFKNSRKSTTYAAQAAAKGIAFLAKKLRIYYLHIKLNGIGRAKGAVVRVLQQSSLKILAIRECTPTVHNGCRPPKIRRI